MARGVAARFLGAISLSLALATPAWADWHVAESEHFVVYADDKAKDVQQFGEYLERYHAALDFLNNRDSTPPSPSNRVTIFVVGDQKDVRELLGTDSRFIRGFYTPRAGGSKAFVEDIQLSGGETSFSLIILLHEYAHHYLMSASSYARPRWMNEGAAEFYASTKFMKDGGVSIGRPALHRASELSYAKEVSIEELFDHELYEKNRGKRYDSFYGRSWLLYHYLFFGEERRGQMTAYVRAMAEGMSSPEAAEVAFGNLDQLDKELDNYARQRRMYAFTLTPDKIAIGDVAVRKLSEGEAAMMPVRIRSQRGVNEEQAKELVVEAQAIAARYPDDAGVQTALAEAEFDAGNDDAAIAAADKAIAIDPNRTNAHVQKGYALFRKAETADDRDTAYQDAVVAFSKLNRIEQDHPIPLIYYYRSFMERGKMPPENAKHALERAQQLAPFDKGLMFQAAMMLAQEGKVGNAYNMLGPLANDPHGGGMAEQATTIRALLLKATEGEPFRPPLFMASTVEVGTDEEEGE